jgi:MFS transporter, ACS family, pantothenate transporter
MAAPVNDKVAAVTASPRPSSDDVEGNGIKYNAWIRFMTWIHWYPADMGSAEKKLVLKLDLMILVYGCLCFFTKYLSQASLTNAFVT